ncbi:uncharacterized protein LOC121052996 [Rosa chinensis]|uniref:uncharacterized protein LOC121052996 n=1 Tax=Rosa chinensis TaxID=74649 RepID=UPI001AD9186B|nr:uncharacterized protein LOC121052996 [Rosa chinensis]
MKTENTRAKDDKAYSRLHGMERNPDWNVFLNIFHLLLCQATIKAIYTNLNDRERCMITRKTSQGKLIPLDSEIERTCRSNRKQTKETCLPIDGPTAGSTSSQGEEDREKYTPSHSPAHSVHEDEEEQFEEPPKVEMAGARPLKDAFVPTTSESPSCIDYTPDGNHAYSIPVQLINSLPEYMGSPSEDPNVHIREFLDICKLQTIQHLPPEGLRLLLFPFSLKDDAKRWLYSLPAGIITSWDEMVKKFLKQYFPAQLTRKLRREIQNFCQTDGDTLYKAWEEFKELQRKCPHHNFALDDLVQYFYDGLDTVNRGSVDSACGGTFMNKTGRQAYDLIEDLADNNRQFHARDKRARGRGVYELDTKNGMQNQMVALERKLDMLVNVMSNGSKASPQVCSICSYSDHTTDRCPMSTLSEEQVNFVGQPRHKYDPYSNTYNPGWKDHPNFRWNNNDNVVRSTQGVYNTPPGFQAPRQQAHQQAPPQQASSKSLEDMLKEMALHTSTFMQETKAQFKEQGQSIKNLERQVGQLASNMQNRPPGTLPSTTVPNPKGESVAELHAMTLRSGKQLEEPIRAIEKFQEALEEEKESKNEAENIKNQNLAIHRPVGETRRPVDGLCVPGSEAHRPVGETRRPVVTENSDFDHLKEICQPVKNRGTPNLSLNSFKANNDASIPMSSCIPFPRRFMNSKKEQHEKDILETFRKVQVNIPLLDAIKQVPKYAKFLKELCINKRRYKDKETVALSEEVSAVLLRKLPPKLKDPGRFTIPCTIGERRFEKALLDLGASINLMPYTMYETLKLGELKDTQVTIQLADRSIAHPKGIVEDVLVQAGELIFPADFFVLEMELEPMPYDLPLILGRLFMRTARTKIDVYEGTLTMEFDGDIICFNIFEAMRYPNDVHTCFSIDAFDYLVQDTFNASVGEDKLKSTLELGLEQNDFQLVKGGTST